VEALTYSDPAAPDIDPPIRRRAYYPAFTAFRHRSPLTVEIVVKLSRAIDNGQVSIAVYGTTMSNLVAWGVVDQIVHQNIWLNREASEGFANPGALTVTMESFGELSVHHGNLFLGGLRQDQLLTRENDALRSPMVAMRIAPALRSAARQIARALGTRGKPDEVLRCCLTSGQRRWHGFVLAFGASAPVVHF